MDTNLCGGGSDNHCSSSKSSVIAALDGKYSEVASITIRKKKSSNLQHVVALGDPCASIATRAPQVEGIAALVYAGNPFVLLQNFRVHAVAHVAASIQSN